MKALSMRFLLAALSLLWLAIVPARASILMMAGEDIDFTIIGSANYASSCSSNTFCRTNWARSAIAAVSTGATSDPPTNTLKGSAFANTGSIWVHWWALPAVATTTANAQLLRLYGSDGVARFAIRGTGTSGQVKLSTRNGAGTFADLATCTTGVVTSALHQFDLQINYAVAGSANLYLDSVNICTFTGDVTTNGITALNQIEFGAMSVSGNTNVSEVIVATTSTLAMNLKTLAPVAAGNTQSWTPSTVGNINPSQINDSNFVATVTNNALTQWTVTALPSGTYNVLGVKQVARVIIGTAGPLNFGWSQRVSGSDFTNGTIAATTSFVNYENYLLNSPATSSPWTSTEVGTGLNLGLKALP